MRFLSIVLFLVAFLVAFASALPAQQPGRLPDDYVLTGTVRDARTGAPLPDIRIWPMEKGWGAVTDSAGRYELRWRGRAVWTFIVRHCGEQNLAAFQVDFFRESSIQHDVSLTGEPRQCTNEGRLPWSVDARDTTRFRGHYTYSWEGGGWLEACDGSTYLPDWDSKLAAQLSQRQKREGQVTFVRFLGRVAPDNLETPPGTVRMTFPGPLFLVNTVEEVRDPRKNDCA